MTIPIDVASGANVTPIRASDPTEKPVNPEDAIDERLIRAAQGGNLDAFNDLVTRHERAVYSVCLRLLRDQAAAEDAAQDTFIRAWGAIDTFRGGVVRPW